MAKLSKASKAAVGMDWTRKLDAAAVREAFEEATVDANGESEQHTGLLTAIEEELSFPFKAKVIGETVSVVGMEWPDGDDYRLDLVCQHNGQKHQVDARSVELLKPFPKGHLLLAAFLDWRRHW